MWLYFLTVASHSDSNNLSCTHYWKKPPAIQTTGRLLPFVSNFPESLFCACSSWLTVCHLHRCATYKYVLWENPLLFYRKCLYCNCRLHICPLLKTVPKGTLSNSKIPTMLLVTWKSISFLAPLSQKLGLPDEESFPLVFETQMKNKICLGFNHLCWNLL